MTSSAASLHGEACGVARPRPAAAAESSACSRDDAVGATSIVDQRRFSRRGSASGIADRHFADPHAHAPVHNTAGCVAAGWDCD